MKIAYIGIKGLPARGGADRVVEAIVHRLASRHHLTVYCSRDFAPGNNQVLGVKLVRFPTLKGKHLRSPSLFILSALHALFFGKYDLIHLHNVEASLVLPLLRLRYRVVSTAHGSINRSPREKWGHIATTFFSMMEYPFMLLSNYRTAVSRIDAQYFQNRHGREVHYIPNGVDTQPAVDTAKARATLGVHTLDEGNYILFAAGRLDPSKGCHLLLEAFCRMRSEYKLAIVAPPAEIPTYDQQLRHLADERVRFIPLISAKEELYGVIRGCRIFVFPSVGEAMSMMLLEAASLGAPIVCSDIPENDLLSGNTVTFESGNAISLQERLQWALDNPETMRTLAEKAQSCVRENYPWDHIAKRYEMLYAIAKSQRPELLVACNIDSTSRL
jgi:glycosyltransferase involved in cell wall biosynthesis